jgi:hypothetical protein
MHLIFIDSESIHHINCHPILYSGHYIKQTCQTQSYQNKAPIFNQLFNDFSSGHILDAADEACPDLIVVESVIFLQLSVVDFFELLDDVGGVDVLSWKEKHDDEEEEIYGGNDHEGYFPMSVIYDDSGENIAENDTERW